MSLRFPKTYAPFAYRFINLKVEIQIFSHPTYLKLIRIWRTQIWGRDFLFSIKIEIGKLVIGIDEYFYSVNEYFIPEACYHARDYHPRGNVIIFRSITRIS